MGRQESDSVSPSSSSPDLHPVDGDLKAKTAHVHEKDVLNSFPPEEWVQRLVEEYVGQHDGEALPPGSDPDRTARAILTLNEEESLKTLRSISESQQGDYSFDQVLMRRIRELIEGHEACGMEQGEWAYTTCKTAGMVHNWSPYAEVRAVTLPYDDPDEPCESFRAYILGYFWVCVCTAVNTCEFLSSTGASLLRLILTLHFLSSL